MSLVLEGINKKFRRNGQTVHVLEDIDLVVKPGEFICILGSSGCGKTTLLNIIAGLEKPSSGRITIHQKEIKGAGPDRTVMFQESALFPWLKVIENVEFGLKMAGKSKEVCRESALKFLEMVRLSQYRNAYVHELSGGMKQRVALARALVMNSEILLMDEPFAALDLQNRRLLQNELLQITRETGKTIIFVTHHAQEAVFLADRILVMSANPGKIKREMIISAQHPRDLGDIKLKQILEEILCEVEVGVSEDTESISGKSGEEDFVLSASNSDLGSDL